MKKKKWTVLAAVAAIAMLLLTACTNTTNDLAFSGELPVPEIPSKELLAGSMEYLLKEGAEPEDIQETQVTVYYGNSSTLELKHEDAAIEQLTPEQLIDSLAKHNIVSLDTKVNSFEEEEDAGGKVLMLDLSGAFREYLKTMSENGEKVILASVTNTFLEAYEAEYIRITVEGDPLETSHGNYEEPMGYMRSEEE